LTVFTRERPDSATVSIRLAVRAGSRDEDDATCGGSHWLEHAYFLGTRTRPDNQAIFAPIEAVGGAANASTGWEATDYFKLVPAENFDLALDVLADQLLNSTFSPDAFNRERLVVHQEHQLRNDDPSVHSFDAFMNLVFQVSPLRRNPGSVVCLDALPLPTILAYRDQRYVTGNVAVAAIGNLHHDEAVSKIEQALAGLRRGPQGARPRTPEPIETAPHREAIGDGSQSVDLRLGWPAPGDVDADSPAMFIVQDILGTTGRRLTEEIRDRTALASSVDADYLDFNDAGALMLSATTQPDLAGQVEAALVAQVRRLRGGDLTDDEVETSKQAIAGRSALADELNDAQTERATIEVSGTLDSYDEYLARLRPVHAADVQRVAQKYLDPANYTLVVVRS
jgi:predicted Zn-dependent peptidase